MSAIDKIRDFNNRLRGLQSDRAEDGFQVVYSKLYNQKAPVESSDSKARKNYLQMISGGNTRFVDDTELSENYKNALSDVIKFYKNEFGFTPHADVYSDPSDFTYEKAVTYLGDTKTGPRMINFERLRPEDEEPALREAQWDAEGGWSVKNSGDIKHVPLHEFGHVVADMLFPYSTVNGENKNLKKLYVDSLKDAGFSVEKGGDLNKQANDILDNMSGYAASTGRHFLPTPYRFGQRGTNIASEHEVVAEALADYYYNRDKATDLSKAIVKRLKKSGATYGLRQAGGVDTTGKKRNFLENLRRYNVIQ